MAHVLLSKEREWTYGMPTLRASIQVLRTKGLWERSSFEDIKWQTTMGLFDSPRFIQAGTKAEPSTYTTKSAPLMDQRKLWSGQRSFTLTILSTSKWACNLHTVTMDLPKRLTNKMEYTQEPQQMAWYPEIAESIWCSIWPRTINPILGHSILC